MLPADPQQFTVKPNALYSVWFLDVVSEYILLELFSDVVTHTRFLKSGLVIWAQTGLFSKGLINFYLTYLYFFHLHRLLSEGYNK